MLQTVIIIQFRINRTATNSDYSTCYVIKLSLYLELYKHFSFNCWLCLLYGKKPILTVKMVIFNNHCKISQTAKFNCLSNIQIIRYVCHNVINLITMHTYLFRFVNTCQELQNLVKWKTFSRRPGLLQLYSCMHTQKDVMYSNLSSHS